VLEVGRVVGSWEVEAHVGSGGMAEVYRVRHTLLGSVHALKVLRPELAAHEDVRRRFLTEGRLQAQLRHPHLIAVTDVVAEAGVAALVMEYLPGGSLEERLEAGGPLPLGRALPLLRSVLAALELLHGRGIVHRDLKPANLLFRDDGWDGVVLVDLGVARVLEEDGARRTRTGVMLGTPAFMSPEQVVGRPVDARSDVFSAGTLAWELLTGTLPFDGDSEFATMQAIVDGRRPALMSVAPGLPREVVAAIEAALAPRPEDRPASAGALAAQLAAAGAARAVVSPDAVAVGPREERAGGPSGVDPSGEAGPRAARGAGGPVGVDPSREGVTRVSGEEGAGRVGMLSHRDDAPGPALGEPLTFPEPPAPRPAPRRGGCWRALLWLMAGGMASAALAGGALWWAASEMERSDRLAREAVEALRVYKTDPTTNAQRDVLDGAAATAAAAVRAWERPEAVGAYALAATWQEGWHLMGARWDEDRYRAAEARQAAVAAHRPTATGAAAEVLVRSAGCRLAPAGDTRDAACAALTGAVATARGVASGRSWGWLGAEVLWQAVVAARAQVARDGADAGRWADLGESWCGMAPTVVGAAPVNGQFLVGSCLGVLGDAGRYDAWLAFADHALASAQREGSVDADLISLLYTTPAPACVGKGLLMKAGADGRPALWSGVGKGGWGDWCVWMGRQAEGCAKAAAAVQRQECRFDGGDLWSLGGLRCDPVREAGVPWEAAEQAAARRAGVTAACKLR
jgi:tRNA A-37 threonylcarbamoyl transferase component Bud32